MEDFKSYLELILDGDDLMPDEAAGALQMIISGQVNEAKTAAFLFGMRQKGETTDELTAFVEVMREAAVRVNVDATGAVDLCGTGGDHSGSFNISTAAMFVVAGAGVPVLKHGNRSISSQCGSADVLEMLGVKPDLTATAVEDCFGETGLAFMFAPLFHPAMKSVMPARQNLGIRTFFNILGPLLNPAGVKRQVIGTYDAITAEKSINILSNLDTEHAITVSSTDGMDEFTTTAPCRMFQYRNGSTVTGSVFRAEENGFKSAETSDLMGGDRHQNAKIIRNILSGDATRAQTEIVLLNAAFAILVSGKTGDIEAAAALAHESVDSGTAMEKLDQLSTFTHAASRN